MSGLLQELNPGIQDILPYNFYKYGPTLHVPQISQFVTAIILQLALSKTWRSCWPCDTCGVFLPSNNDHLESKKSTILHWSCAVLFVLRFKLISISMYIEYVSTCFAILYICDYGKHSYIIWE